MADPRRQNWTVFCLVALGVGLIGCVVAPNNVTSHTGSESPVEPIPDLPIVFNATKTNVLGFGNLDEGDYAELSIYSEGPMTNYVSWSLDGTSLVSRMRISQNLQAGYPMVIQSDGSILTCPIFGTGGLTALDNHTVVTVRDETSVVRVDMETCEADAIYTHDAYIANSAFSSIGWLALDDSSGELTIIDDKGNTVFTVSDCTLRNWSADGERLAYRCKDGLFVADKSGSDSQMILEDAGWASWIDDEALLFTKDSDIWFFDMTTHEERRLFTNGNFPSWRPGQ